MSGADGRSAGGCPSAGASRRCPRAGDILTSGTPAAAPRVPPFNRIAYSAAHVVADPRADIDPWLDCAIDWDTTIAYRQHLWRLGLGVAEAMDTAQRGMGLDWPTSLELIRRSLDAARDVPGAVIASGAGTDHLAPEAATSIDDVIRAYEEQVAAIEKLGGRIILMASRALARVARSPADYERVYDRILSQVREPVIIHWLGDMFDPALAGYWGSADPMAAMQVALDVINSHAAKVDGVKISLLDKDKEIAMRRRLAAGRAHVHRRRLQLCRADRRRCAGPQRRAARHLRRDRAGGLGRAGRAGRRRPRALRRDPRARRCRCRATSSRRRRASTRPASCSWPI